MAKRRRRRNPDWNATCIIQGFCLAKSLDCQMAVWSKRNEKYRQEYKENKSGWKNKDISLKVGNIIYNNIRCLKVGNIMQQCCFFVKTKEKTPLQFLLTIKRQKHRKKNMSKTIKRKQEFFRICVFLLLYSVSFHFSFSSHLFWWCSRRRIIVVKQPTTVTDNNS